MTAAEIEPIMLDVAGILIAVRRRPGAAPGLFWLGGYRSDMRGTKAEALDQWALRNGHAFVRHDYSGHGESGGAFKDGSISRWLEESMAVLRQFTTGPQILIGSSMGAWIALRMIQELGKTGENARVGGMVLLAPAPDFTVELMEPRISKRQKRDLAEKGYFEERSNYSSDPNVYTRELFEDGRRNRVLDGMIETHCPIHILHGMRDPDVPHSHALKLVEHLPVCDVTLSLVRDGDHRLSRPQDIEMLLRAVEQMVQQAR